jgi:hypothetical protein
MVSRLRCLRDISTLTAFGLAVEIGDRHRFSGSSIGAYLGLVPTEQSSGDSRSQGSITKAGNTHVRRLLVEAAWHHRRPYRPTKSMQARWEQAPAATRPAVMLGTNDCTTAGKPSPPARSGRSSSSRASSPAGADGWPPSRSTDPAQTGRPVPRRRQRVEPTRG